MQEIWKDIEGYNGAYQVSNMGRIKSMKRGKQRILNGFKNEKGYHRIDLWFNNKSRKFFIHRLVGFAFCKGYKEGLYINHINGDKDDNKYSNLEWCTDRENKEAFSTRRSIYGVGIYKHRRKFKSIIYVNHTRYYLGLYDTPKQARQARQDFKTKHNLK